MPRQGRRDRFFMMCLDAPTAAETVAEAGWMLDNDPQGYRERDPTGRRVLRRTRRS